jgi:thioredoxin 1
MAPVLEAVEKSYAGRIKVEKINSDEDQATANRYGVRAVPTLLLIKDGRVVDQLVGAVSRSKLEDMIDRHTS